MTQPLPEFAPPPQPGSQVPLPPSVNATVEAGTLDAYPAPVETRPTSMWLTLEGAAGTQIAIYELDKNRPVLIIDGVRAKRDINGYFKVPMANGKTEKLKVRATVPGYPTLTFRGRVLYRSPKPPAMRVIGYLVPALGSFAFVASLAGGIIGAIAAVGTGYGAAAWIRNAEKKAVPYIVLVGCGVLLGALGLLVASVRLGAFDG